MENKIILHGKAFDEYMSEDMIQSRIRELATQIDADYENQTITLVGNLTGAFIIMADLCRHLKTNVDIKFVKYTSYEGMNTTHVVNEKMGFDQIDLEGKHVLIVEDIIDTGLTLDYLLNVIEKKGAASVGVFSLLLKPESVQKTFNIEYVGFEIPNDFVIGYGLDYDGLGRDLRAIYKLSASE